MRMLVKEDMDRFKLVRELVCLARQVLAVILGIALTYIIRPGRDKPFVGGGPGGDCAAAAGKAIASHQ